MAKYYRAQVSASNPADPGRDTVVNTLHFKSVFNVLLTATEAESICNDLAVIFSQWRPAFAGLTSFTAKLYNIEVPAPHEPLAIKTVVETANAGTLDSPREVALCLSYKSSRYGPRGKGRLYIGPWPSTPGRPTAGMMSTNLNRAQALANLGGTDLQWCVFSPTTRAQGGSMDDAMQKVSEVWCDNEWDIVRSRGRRATTRQTQAMEG